MSPIVPTRPDPNQTMADQDMNTWESINPASGPQKQWQQSRGYAIYRATSKLPKSMQSIGGRIVFEQMIGFAQIYIGRDQVASKQGASSERLEITIPPSSEKLMITVLLQSDSFPAGIAQFVELLASD